tara:strand:- start:127 stop:936 length:810 start_codon:yes stop_codon:yes gene_type:complete
MKDGVEVSVVLPSYHGADVVKTQVPVLLEYLGTIGVDYEVIIVDDGSCDGGKTEQAAKILGCRYLENLVNQGKGSAVRRGMLAARGKFRIFTDIDIPFEISTIERMLYYLQAKSYHFVAGDRTLENSSYFVKVSRARRAMSHIYSNIVGRLVAGGWFDTQCGIKGFRDYVAEDLFSVGRIDRFAFDVELFYVALKRNYDIKRIPVELRCNEISSVNILRDGTTMVLDLPKILFNQLFNRYQPTESLQEAHNDSEDIMKWRRCWPNDLET